MLINRAGFTGEKLGFEIYYPKDVAPEQEKKLRDLAPKFGGREVTEFQIMAWTLPCEAGFYYMRNLRHTNPCEVDLASGIRVLSGRSLDLRLPKKASTSKDAILETKAKRCFWTARRSAVS